MTFTATDLGAKATRTVSVKVVALAMTSLLVARLGAAATDRAEAQAAADASALAGAAEGEAAARSVAKANGARITAYVTEGLDTEVTVVLGEARATARATRLTEPGGVGEAERR